MTSEELLKTKSGRHWKRISVKRRSGAVVPLFSIYSNKSTGIGEISDLKNIVRWLKKTGQSLLQLLPMNETGSDFSPYNSVSSFALEPMYLTLKELKEVNITLYKEELKKIKKKFRCGTEKVNYGIKNAKLDLLYEVYKNSYLPGIRKYEKFKEENKYWLEDYVTFKVLKSHYSEKEFTTWDEKYRDKNSEEVASFRNANEKQLEFFRWIQWQEYEQLTLIRKYANENGVYIIGDIPFLVSRDSADVWAHPGYFRMDYSAGAPPDMYFSKGQRWGMPPYNRDAIEKDGYGYIINKLKYASNFFDMFRIDHFVGLFRLWTIHNSKPLETAGLEGEFSPADENAWEMHGKKIIDAMLSASDMMPLAEDLGVVPECAVRTLEEYGIPGINVQRWTKERVNKFDFTPPENYRLNSVVCLSTHDSSNILSWWSDEAGTIDRELFKRLCGYQNITGERYEKVMNNLFDLSHKDKTRLLWKDEIDSKDRVLWELGLNENEAYNILMQYLDSYRERNKFADYIGVDKEYIPVTMQDEEFRKSKETDTDFVEKCLRKASSAESIFSIQLFQEWLLLYDSFFRYNKDKPFRINYPGSVNDSNWRCVIPFNIEMLDILSINKTIWDINRETDRI